MGSVSHVDEDKKDLVKDVHMLAPFDVRLENSTNVSFMVHYNARYALVVEVKSKKHLDKLLMNLKESVLGKLNESLSLGGRYGALRYQERLCVPNVDDLRNQILEESHGLCYSIHMESTKMYHNHTEVFLLEGLKRDIEEFVAKCPNCQLVKTEHQKLGGLLQEIHVPN
ncbi:uncharacterized protein [Solanum lycopersicum]|uniref:uncharacterized protein n=1 Tax=Solanum lycopersicum TaxID=4081 RepID=UPI003749D30A